MVGSIVAQRIVRGRVVGIKEAEEIGARSVFEDVEKRKRITKRIQLYLQEKILRD